MALGGLYYTSTYTIPDIGKLMYLIGGEHTADGVAEDRSGWTIESLVHGDLYWRVKTTLLCIKYRREITKDLYP